MNKILLIIQREYLTRVKKKSFLIMSIVGPLLMAAIFVIPVWLSTNSDHEELNIAIVDQTHEYYKILEDTETVDYTYLAEASLDSLKKNFFKNNYDGILYIPSEELIEKNKVEVFSENQLNIQVLRDISSKLENKIEEQKMKDKGISKAMLNSLKTKVDINSILLKESGEESESSAEASMVIGMVFALIIYMFIFMYGAQVMRGVMEEKTGRIVEIIISSVKPFQLMMGKIVGIALVALTQFALWVVLTLAIVTAVNFVLVSTNDNLQEQVTQMTQNTGNSDEIQAALEQSDSKAADFFKVLYSLPFGMIIFTFVFFFIGGYLLYASLFAAIGGAVDNETDTQQFMLPITIPLILAIVLAQVIIQNPNGSVAFWFSIIPFTSPVIMIIRVGFGVEWWEMALSMFLLIITFIGTTWIAAKIYRTGILLYGKKVTYKELWKWLRY